MSAAIFFSCSLLKSQLSAKNFCGPAQQRRLVPKAGTSWQQPSTLRKLRSHHFHPMPSASILYPHLPL